MITVLSIHVISRVSPAIHSESDAVSQAAQSSDRLIVDEHLVSVAIFLCRSVVLEEPDDQ